MSSSLVNQERPSCAAKERNEQKLEERCRLRRASVVHAHVCARGHVMHFLIYIDVDLGLSCSVFFYTDVDLGLLCVVSFISMSILTCRTPCHLYLCRSWHDMHFIIYVDADLGRLMNLVVYRTPCRL